ncbi:hypothetical protein HWV62_1775 [Athelia sp. TMB]|nr:hypothetical protein HWV62_1775 [Athelia sp. TMB]
MANSRGSRFVPDPFDIGAQLTESLRLAQLKNEELAAQKLALEKDFGGVRAELIAMKAAGSRKQTTLSYLPALRLLGKKSAAVHSPWLEKHVFDKDPLPEGTAPFTQFKDEDSYERYLSGVLRAYVPQKYHDDMLNGTEFRDLRSVAVRTVLENAGVLFNKCSDIFMQRKEPRSTDPDLCAYLRWPGDKGYSSMAPILFGDHCKHNIEVIFRSKLLVLMCYVVSDDHCFQKVGAVTKIEYWKNFRMYQQWLKKHADTDLGGRVFRYYNKHVFADIADAKHDTEGLTQAAAPVDDFEAMLAAKFGTDISLKEGGNSSEDDRYRGDDDQYGGKDDRYGGEDDQSGGKDGQSGDEDPDDLYFDGDDFDDGHLSGDDENHGEDFALELRAIDDNDSDESDDDFFSGTHDQQHVSAVRALPIPPPRNQHHVPAVNAPPLPPLRGRTAAVDPIIHSSSGLVPPDAIVPGAATALPSAEAARARPHAPPTIIPAQSRIAPVPAPKVTAASNIQQTDHTAAPGKSKRSVTAQRPVVPNPSSPVSEVLSTVIEETLSSTRQTRSSSKTVKTTKTTTSHSRDQATADPGSSMGRKKTAVEKPVPKKKAPSKKPLASKT